MKRLTIIIMAVVSIVVMNSFVLLETGRKGKSLTDLWRGYDKVRDEDRVRDMADVLENIKARALKEKAPWNYIKASEEYVAVESRRNWKLTDSLVGTLDLMPEILGGDYPAVPYLRYRKIQEQPDSELRMEELRKLADEYRGMEIGLLAEDNILVDRFFDMEGRASSDDYMKFEKEVSEFGKKCSELKGDAAVVAEMCHNHRFILEQLRSENAAVIIEDGRAEVSLRNLDKIKLKVFKDDETLYETELVNKVRSFYRQDTLFVTLPAFNDGEYEIGIYDDDGRIGTVDYEKYTVSLACRAASDGTCIYAADYMSGEPLSTADIILYDNDGRKVSEIKDFIFDGFTPLPKDFLRHLSKDNYLVSCAFEDEGMLRMSERMNIRYYASSSSKRDRRYLYATIMKDRSAFVPGDTVRFKAVLYEEHPDGSLNTVGKDYETVVKLFGPEYKVVSEIKLKTNEFGSISGGFALDGKGRNGNYRISVYEGEKSLASSIFKVDEFILPSYDLTFNKPEKLYLPGDEVRVTGRVRSFSGHGFDGLTAQAEIKVNYRKVDEKPVVIAPDGSFELAFTAGGKDDSYVSYGAVVRLTDRTGETLEFEYSSRARSSVLLNASVCNSDTGQFGVSEEREDGRVVTGGIVSGDVAEIHCWVSSLGTKMTYIPIDYELRHAGRTLRSGRTQSDDTLALDMTGLAAGLYDFEMRTSVAGTSGREVASSKTCTFLYMPEDVDYTPEDVDRVFCYEYKDGMINMQFGTGTGPLWAVVELFGEGEEVLKKEMVALDGRAGEPGSLVTLNFPHLKEYTDNLLLNVFWFRNGMRYRYDKKFVRPKEYRQIPLSFTSFEDRTLPGQECRVSMMTAGDAELLAAVYDASSDKVADNRWRRIVKDKMVNIHVPYSYVSGYDGGHGGFSLLAYGTSYRKSLYAGRAGNIMADAAPMKSVAEDEAIPFQLVENDRAPQDVAVRDDFATTLAFEPFLRPSADGKVELKFRTSDKLSTFKVMVYAHDKEMNNSLAVREMLVTLPVKVSLAAPQYLHEGDRYVLRASVSNLMESDMKGKLYLEVYEGEEYLDVEPLKMDHKEVMIPAGGSVGADFEIEVPECVDSLAFKVVFVGHESGDGPVNEAVISDGVFMPVPVYPDEQILTEAHSAVLPGGMDAEEVLAGLRGEFVNVSAEDAELEEISIMDMLKKALPLVIEPECKNAVSLSEAVYMNLLGAGLHENAEAYVGAAMNSVSGLLELMNSDGGFGWFDGMASSPVITALILERYAGLRDRGLLDIVTGIMGEDALDSFDEAVVKAVRYLDVSFFGESGRPSWYGGLSLGQYLNVRSMFAGVDFDGDAFGRKELRKFRKDVKTYLLSEKMTQGDILGKVRKAHILNVMTSSEAGAELAGEFVPGSVKKMKKAMNATVESLKQYAVEHPSGGIYYPNAILPWRGLLESEAYAHARIADLFGDLGLDELADGIRIWIMIQKETQEWAAEPGFMEAVASVYDGSDKVKETKALILRKEYSKPFDEIKASGNGFRIKVDYWKSEADGGRVKLSDGDRLRVGDKITAVYSLWSSENRSHVRLSVPRASCIRPVNQLSGWSGGWFRPVVHGFMNISPYSYREVKADRTIYWIDVFPEENTSIEEELFVTQEGTFKSPAAEIESVYAPHYRANDEAAGALEVES